MPVTIAVVAGGLFGRAYLATRRLWLAIGLHTGWNFTLGSLFSMAVSGRAPASGVLTGRLEGPQWLTGGDYGLEASVVTLVLLLGAGASLLRRAAARRHIVAWADRATRNRSEPAGAFLRPARRQAVEQSSA